MSLLTQTNTLRGARLSQQTAFKQATVRAPASRVALRVEANKRVQKKAKVVLTSDVPNVGTEGQVTTVKIGYFRNWLYPQGLAKPATTTILDALRKEKDNELRKRAEEKAQAQAFAEVLRNVGKVVIKKKAAESEKIFGSVSTQEVVDALLQATGRKLDKNDITIPDIKSLGDHECTVRLHAEVTGAFTVSVVKEKDIKITVKGGRR